MAKGVALRRLSRRGSWVQIPPPAPEIRLILELFWLIKPNLGSCEWGLKNEHTFTGKGRAGDDCNYCTH